MARLGREVQSWKDYILGTDRRLFRNMSVWDSQEKLISLLDPRVPPHHNPEGAPMLPWNVYVDPAPTNHATVMGGHPICYPP